MHRLFSFFQLLGTSSVLALCVLVLALVIKGKYNAEQGKIEYQTVLDSQVGSPFESTNTTSRYVLTQAIVEGGTVLLTEQQARQAAPDVVFHNGTFQSIFTPGVSLLAAPFYWLGKQVQLPQLGVFTGVAFLAVLNTFLVIQLSSSLGVSRTWSLVAGLTFLFGTNALAYALTLTQHHGTIFVLLCSMLLVRQPPHWIRGMLLGALFGVGTLIDIPNVFLLSPVLLYAASQFVRWQPTKQQHTWQLQVSAQIVSIVAGVLPLLIIFAVYNTIVSGSPTTLGQFLGRTNYFDTEQQKAQEKKRNAEKVLDPYHRSLPLQTRTQIEGLHVLSIGDERGWLHYSPVLFLGFLGIFWMYQQKNGRYFSVLCISIIAVNLTIYSMFGDPWGGWSFGARYLLPSAALLSACIGVALHQYRKMLIKLIFLVLVTYSVYITIAGSLTTAAIPPKQETSALGTNIPYTSEYNFRLIRENKSSSLVYDMYFKDILSVHQYFNYLVVLCLLPIYVLVGGSIVQQIARKKK